MKNFYRTSSLLLGSLALLAFSSCANNPAAIPKATSNPTAKIKPYPLDTCMVIGAKLSSTPKTYTRIHNGQEVKFCCTSCIIAFEANPEPFMAKLK